MEQETMVLPVVALRGITVLPDMIVHFDVTREKSVQAIEYAMNNNQKVFLVAQRDSQMDDPEVKDLYVVGVIAEIKQVLKLPSKVLRVMAEGVERAKLLELDTKQEYLTGQLVEYPESKESYTSQEEEAMLRTLKELFEQYGTLHPKIKKDSVQRLTDTSDIYQLSHQIMVNLPVDYKEKQRLLETVDFEQRYEVLCNILANEIEIFHIRQELQGKIQEKVDKNQKEYLLREQMRVIREELGEDTISEAQHLEQQVEKTKSRFTGKRKIKERN